MSDEICHSRHRKLNSKITSWQVHEHHFFIKNSSTVGGVIPPRAKVKVKSIHSTSVWAASDEFDTYRLCEQRRFRRACASAQSRQNLRCSLIQAVSQEEFSNRKPDPWPLWMAGHAQLKFVMTECSKTQIRLTRHGVICKQIWTLKLLQFVSNDLDILGGCCGGCWRMHKWKNKQITTNSSDLQMKWLVYSKFSVVLQFLEIAIYW